MRPLYHEKGPLLMKIRQKMPYTTPYCAIPFRDSIAEGGVAPICLVSCGIAQVQLRYPFSVGGIAPPLRMLSKGGSPQKRERASHPIGHVETPKPIARNRGVSLR